MFFEGDLQSGIALAIQDSKLVACFVRDDGEESSRWEDSYLQDEEVAPLLQSKTVLLRLHAGSQEAGYLSAFCPISKAPTLVIIHNGQLREYLAAGLSQDEIKQRLKAVLTDQSSATTAQASHTPPEETPQQSTSASTQQPPTTHAPIPPSTPAEPAAPDTTVRDLLQDRRDRLEAEKTRQDATAIADRQAKAKARREDAEAHAANAAPSSSKSPEMSYAQQQRKRQQDARQERERIMRQIEADKADRREREERRRALARAEAGANSSDGADGLVDRQLSSEDSQRCVSTRPSSKDCAVQVRLLDGSTIRSRFPSAQTLRRDVRAWVDEQRSDGDIPYTFTQILAPKPNRAITISEEEESLQSLGLTPSATLVMVPVQGSIAAYGSGGPGLLSRGLSAGYGLVSGGVGVVTGALGAVLGVGPAAQPAGTASTPSSVDGQSSNDGPPSTAGGRHAGGGVNVRTLRDQQAAGEDHQFYNGNQLNFEPRKDQDDKRD